MSLRTLPSTDLQVSPIVLGAMNFGETWDSNPISDRQVRETTGLIDAAMELGINHVDLADIYTQGKSERIVGRILRDRPGLRDRLVLQDKCGIVLADADLRKHYDLSHGHIVRAVEASLRRLGTGHIDLLALHRPDPLVEPAEVARAFDELHAAGKVRYFGVSNHSAAQIQLLKQFVDQPIVVNQLQLSLCHHRMITAGIEVNTGAADQGDTAGLLDYCRLHQVTVQAWSPLNGGRMFDPDYNPRLSAAIDRMAEGLGTAREAVALAWLMRHPAGIQPIVGTLRPERLAKCAEAADISMTRTQWFDLLEAARGAEVP